MTDFFATVIGLAGFAIIGYSIGRKTETIMEGKHLAMVKKSSGAGHPAPAMSRQENVEVDLGEGRAFVMPQAEVVRHNPSQVSLSIETNRIEAREIVRNLSHEAIVKVRGTHSFLEPVSHE